jgi:hypothetical protein
MVAGDDDHLAAGAKRGAERRQYRPRRLSRRLWPSFEQLKRVAKQYKAIHLRYARLKNRQCLRASEYIPIK